MVTVLPLLIYPVKTSAVFNSLVNAMIPNKFVLLLQEYNIKW